ncbi:two-component system, NtrC family, nitrogen regulation sensor histidine kinase NtrY [Humidesulfovibrio mexicanus]|uniref:histidine kinase n=1 Tax=Humidesulfovibrio mexicanus TaxID=147047 RepID=A0A239BVV9_9BACT|nr:ATP-binding protein [Humidesulfovibrio mexicanus]SNS12040.1 two-component system, NtrC family, nitrogen regulation sensor histidine kinase NtrY [Humidesulfovibrio mexicanus]
MEPTPEHRAAAAPPLPPELRERQRRKREIGIALAGMLVIVVLTWVELRLLGVNSYLFLGLVNLNIILLLLVLFVVGRNGVKLLLERRRNVLGSRLRTRLVLAFILLSLVPVALMFYVSAKFVQTSVDYWFKSQVEDSMEQSLEIGRAFYQSAQARVEQRGREVLAQVAAAHYGWGGRNMDTHLAESLREYGLAVVGVISPEGRAQNTHPPQVFDRVWSEARTKVNLEDLRKNPRYVSVMLSTSGNDLIVGLLPVDEGRAGFLVLGESIGGGLMYKLDQVARGLDEYKKLRKLKYPWKMTLYLTLGVMSLLIVLGASWFGFRLAKEISAPVQAMAAGTERIAKGDLSVRLDDTADDELGSLVRSFNRMAEDLEAGQKRLLDAQERMAQQYEELERRGRYIEAVLDNITSGVVSTDASGRIGTVNKAAEAMLGVNAEQLVGRKAQHLVRGEFAELLTGALKHLAKVPEARWTRQIDLQLKDRGARFLVNLVGLTGGDAQAEGTGLVAVFEDITELEKVQRLAAWQEVAQRIAHEIKNPLTPIKLSAQRLMRKFSAVANDKSFDDCAALIVREAERLQQMVAEFSGYAKLPEVQLVPGDLPPLLAEVVGTFATAHRGIRWELDAAPGLPPLPFDAEGLRKVFINLLTNAAEALEGRQDGRVLVRAAHDPARGLARISVEDNGPGFTQEERARMFEPYFSRKKTGTGLGLTIVRSIVTDHKGQVRVEAARPSGSIFMVELPLA